MKFKLTKRTKEITITIAIFIILLIITGYLYEKEVDRCEENGGTNVGGRYIVCVKPDSIIDYNKGDK